MKRKLLLAFCALLIGWSNASAHETPTNGSGYYIYNADNDLFFTRGADWGTQAYASPIGIPWKVEVDGSGNYILKMYDINTQNNNDKGLGFNGSYTDNGSPIPLTPSGNASDGFTLKNGDNYITCPATKGVVTMTPTASKWKFLTQAQYEAVLASRASTQEAAVAASKGIVIPGGNTLNGVVSDANAWVSTTTQDALPTTSSWSISGNAQRGGAYNQGAYGVELFQTNNASITKTISGLAKGIYKVVVRGMKRMGTNEGSVALETAGFYVSDAYMEANGNIIPVKSWAANNTAANVPDGPNAVVTIIGTGGYTSEGFVYVGNDGKLTMTLHNDAFWWGCWTVFNGVSYTFYNDEVSDDDVTAIIATAIALEAKEMDGDLLSALSEAKTTLNGAHTIANYNALQAAIEAAQASADAYALFAPERTKARELGMSEEAIAAVAPDVNALKVAEYNFVTTDYAYEVKLGSWTTTGKTAVNKGQHWDGTSESTYLEQLNQDSPAEGWHKSSWEVGYNQDINLPAGNYVFKVAGRRSSDDVNLSLIVTNKDTKAELGKVNDFPKGDTGKGIDTSGATNFGDGEYAYSNNGRGWEWRYVKFTLASDATVNVAISAVASSIHQWMSFCNPTVRTDDEANISLIAYNIALNDANTAINNASYTNVTGFEKTALQAAIDADDELDKTDADAIDEARATLVAATTAFTGAKEIYDAWVGATVTKITENVGTGEFQYNETTNNLLYNAYVTARNHEITSSTTAATVADWTEVVKTAIDNYLDQPLNAPYKNQAYVFTNTTAVGSLSVATESVTIGEGYVFFTAVDGGYVISNSDQEYIFKTTGNNWTLSTTENKNDAYVVTVKYEGDGKYSIHGEKGYFGTDATDAGTTVYANKAVGDNGKWTISRKAASVNVSEAGWATLYTPYALDFFGVEGLKAYTATVAESTVTLTQVNDVPANTGVVLKGAENTYTIPVIASSETAKGSLQGSATETTDADAAPAGKAYYILTKDGDNDAKFSPAEGTIAAGKAYLEYDWSAGGSGVKALNVVVDGTITGVEDPVAAEAEEEGVLYNTAGQVVTKDYKGIIIKNGKKYLNK